MNKLNQLGRGLSESVSSTTTGEQICDGWFLTLELFVSYVPGIIFIIGGYHNFKQIRSIGFNRVVQFSKLFKIKISACYVMMAINTINIFVGIIWP